MSGFNPTNYFNERLGSEATSIKPRTLAEISADKRRLLSADLELTAAKSFEIAAAKNSLVNRLGFEEGSTSYNLLNTAVDAVVGTSRLAGNIASLPNHVIAWANQANIPEEDVAALNRWTSGKGTQEDYALITRGDGNPNNPTTLDKFKQLMAAQQRARATHKAFDISSLSDPTAKNQLARSLEQAYNGDSTLADTARAVANNGWGVLGYTAENAPQVAVALTGPVGIAALTASNVGYAADTYLKGAENDRAKTNEALPPEDRRNQMLRDSIGVLALEQAADLVSLGAAKALGKTAASVADSATSIPKAVVNVAKAGGKGFISEAPTEAGQTYLEGQIEGTPKTAAEIYAAGVIGGASGAAITGALRTPVEAAQVALGAVSTPSEEKDPVKAAEVVKEATKTGNVDALLDPESSTYNPSKAAAALFEFAKRAEATDEDRANSEAKVQTILDTLAEDKAALERRLDLVSEEGLARKDAKIAELKEQLSTLAPDSPEAKEVQDNIDTIDGFIKQRQKEEAADRRKLKNIDSTLASIEQSRELLGIEIAQKEPIEDQIAKVAITPTGDAEVDAAQVEVATKAAERIIVRAMANPTQLDAKVAEDLANDTTNAFTDTQRKYLRQLSASRVAENALKDMDSVSSNIFSGTDDQVGLIQHRKRVTQSLMAKNESQANKHLNVLFKFSESHRQKAALFAQAVEVAVQGIPSQVQKNKDGTWMLEQDTKKFLSPEKLRTNGGLQPKADSGGVSQGARDLLKNLQLETSAIDATFNELSAAYELRLQKPVPTTSSTNSTTTNVSNNTTVPQTVGSSIQTTGTTATATPTTNTGTLTGTTVGGNLAQTQAQTEVATTTPTSAGFTLTPRTKFTPKDQEKASLATAFIGQGSERSSTNSYAQDAAKAGIPVNSGKYTNTDVVFISAEGQRSGRVPPNLTEIGKAVAAGATILTDDLNGRNTKHNVGEREVATFLGNSGYVEATPGRWTPPPKTQSTTQTQALQEAQKVLTGLVSRYSPEMKIDLVESEDLAEGQDGQAIENADGSFTVKLRPGMPAVRRAAVVAHEYGHALQTQEFTRADSRVKNAIRRAFEADKGAVAKIGTKEALVARFGHVADVLRTAELQTGGEAATDAIARRDGKEFSGYTLSFDEWFANQVSKYATSGDFSGLDTEVKTFWQSIIAKLKEVHAALVRDTKATPDFAKWMNSLAAEAHLRDGATQQVKPEAPASSVKSTTQANSQSKKEAQSTEEEASVEEATDDIDVGLDEPNIEDAPNFDEPPPEDQDSLPPWDDGALDIDDAVADAIASQIAAEQEAGVSTDEPPPDFDLEAPAEEAAAEVAVEPGTLEATTKTSAAGAVFTAKEFGDFFKQTAQNPLSSSPRPLVVAKNFLSLLRTNLFTASKFLETEIKTDGSDGKKIAALKTFVEKAAQWADLITADIRTKNRYFFYEDMSQYLVENTDGKLDFAENVKTAMVLAAFNWISREGVSAGQNTPDDVNVMLGLPKGSYVDPVTLDYFQNIGKRQALVANDLGRTVVQALGIKAKPGTPKDVQARLEASLGARVLKMMLHPKVGLVERTTIPADVFAAFSGSPTTSAQFFISIKQVDGRMSPQLRDVFSSLVGSQNVLDKLFGTEEGLLEPSATPVKFTQQKINGTDQGIPKKTAKHLAHENSVASFFKEDMLKLARLLDLDVLAQIAGAISASSTDAHVDNRKKYKAKNDGIYREIENLFLFADSRGEDGVTAPMYFSHELWRQHRVGIGTNLINPQSSKFHREMTYRGQWKVDVPTDPDSSVHQRFLLVAGEKLGIKVGNYSKAKSLEAVKAKLAEPKIAAAIAVLENALTAESLSQADQETLLAGVKAGKENTASFSALLEIAKMNVAIRDGKTSFNTTLSGEVDGVTNGPMLSTLVLGAVGIGKDIWKVLNRGGFYKKGSVHNEHNLWKADAGSDDLYEAFAKSVEVQLQSWLRNSANGQPIDSTPEYQLLSAIYGFTGNFVDDSGRATSSGRKRVKTPLTATTFGASRDKAVSNMADDFIETIYSRIETAAAEGLDALPIIRDLNVLFADAGLDLIPENTPLLGPNSLMEKQINASMAAALKRTFNSVVGAAVSETLDLEMGALTNIQKEFTKISGTVFQIYNSVYQLTRNRYINELMDLEQKQPGSGIAFRLGKDKQRIPLHELNAEQEAKLKERIRNVLPVAHTAMSKFENNLAAGLRIAKGNNKIGDREALFSEVVFNTDAGIGAKSIGVNAMTTQEIEPGVGALPMMVHSLDSLISAMANGFNYLNEVLNIHDAHGTGIGQQENVSLNLNRATWRAALDYSPAREMHNALSRSIIGLADLIDQNLLPRQVLGKIDFTKALVQSMTLAADADTAKYTAMSEMQSVSQYALEGGAYEVTDDDRNLAANRLKGIQRALSPQEQAALAAIKKFQKNPPKELESTGLVEAPVPIVEPEVKVTLPHLSAPRIAQVLALMQSIDGISAEMKAAGQTVLDSLLAKSSIEDAFNTLTEHEAMQLSEYVNSQPADHNFWGEVNDAIYPSDSTLAEFFQNNQQPTAEQVLVQLANQLSKVNTKEAKFQKFLIERLRYVVPKDLKIQYITPSTPESVLPYAVPDNSRGWFASGGQGVFFLSPQFRQSGLTIETVLHELTHAALVDAARSTDPQVQQLVKELDALRLEAKAAVDANPELQNAYAAAVSNVDEFIAWGMNSRGFQTKVLIGLQTKTKVGAGNKLVSMMRGFIEQALGILFHRTKQKPTDAQVNGLTALVTGVSGLFEQQSRLVNAIGSAGPVEVETFFMANPSVPTLNTYNTTDIHRALDDGSVDPSFQEHLEGVLNQIVERIHGPFGALKAALMKDQALTPMDVWLKALNTNAAPFASEALGANFAVSDQVLFAMEQVEATAKAILNNNQETHTKFAYRELVKLYEEVRKRVTPDSFLDQPMSATQAEKDEAKALYDFIFKVDQQGRTSNYLARFMAMGLTHPKFNELLASPTGIRSTAKAQTFADRLQNLFVRFLDFISLRATKTYKGQLGNARLKALVNQLVDIEAKNRNILANAQAKPSLTSGAELAFKQMSEKALRGVVSVTKAGLIANSRFATVRLAGSMTRIVANKQVAQFLSVIEDYRKSHFGANPGMMAGVLKELSGHVVKFQELIRAAKINEGKRKDIEAASRKALMVAFEDGGAYLSKSHKNALTSVLLRSGAYHLIDDYSLDEIATMLRDRKALDAAIQKETKSFTVPALIKNYYQNQANVLGYFKATGKVRGAMLLMNAYSITRLFGTSKAGAVSEATAAAHEAAVSRLAALYALKYAPTGDAGLAAEVIERENARADGLNGTAFMLQLHREVVENQAKQRLFANKEALHMHGYTSEITNPYVELAIATEDEGKELIARGYVQKERLTNDRSDPNQEIRYYYVLHGAGLQPRVSGAFSLTGMHARGEKKHSGWLNPNTLLGQSNANMQATIYQDPMRQRLLNDSFMNAQIPDLNQVYTNFMAPVLNPDGDIVNWRYLMSDHVKDTTLRRENDFAKVLGTLAASVYDKETTPVQNQAVIKALKEQFDAEYSQRPRDYVMIGKNSPEAEFKEYWDLLPQEAQKEAKQAFGGDFVMVRQDSLGIIFGYRKDSLAEAFRKDPKARAQLEQMFVWMVEHSLKVYARTKGLRGQDVDDYAKRAAVYITRAERVWQEFASEIKDIIVVKSGLVLMGNVWSNFTLLWMAGVPLTDMLKHHLVALKGEAQYRQDSERLAYLKMLKSTGYVQAVDDNIDTEIIKLEDSIARNPVTPLIESGLMPTIVEDLAADEDPYSYKSALVEKIEAKTSRMPKAMANAARTLYMAHDTKMYKGLSRITQLSDFVARYSLYKYETTKPQALGRLSHEEAIQKASEWFVNYDIPMQHRLQYFDDMGILPFMKYFLRIQRVLLQASQENPARALALMAGNQFLDLGPTVLASSMFAKFGNNPVYAGAINYVPTLPELATVAGPMALVK